MINLKDDKQYYILIDQQGGTFGGGRILEGTKEVFEQFGEWADNDGMEDPTLKGYTFADLIEVWGIDIHLYDGKEFQELSESELNTINN